MVRDSSCLQADGGLLGDSLRARKFDTQRREAEIAVNILNRMAELGTPCSVAVER